jgi:hypothetical protein
MGARECSYSGGGVVGSIGVDHLAKGGGAIAMVLKGSPILQPARTKGAVRRADAGGQEALGVWPNHMEMVPVQGL